MKNDTIAVEIRGIMPTTNGCAVFLGNEHKVFVIYVDQSIGSSISMALNDVQRERPLTHDLIGLIFKGLGVELQRVVIVDADQGTFFARIILKMSNELGTKLVEIDARPSDSIVLALQAKKPVLVARKVLDEVEDMTEILKKIQSEEGNQQD